MDFVNLLGLQRGILSTYHRAWLVISSPLRHFYICHPRHPCSQLSPLPLCKVSLSKAATGSRKEHEGVVSRDLLSQWVWAKMEAKERSITKIRPSAVSLDG